jgi:hypothetical protein
MSIGRVTGRRRKREKKRTERTLESKEKNTNEGRIIQQLMNSIIFI